MGLGSGMVEQLVPVQSRNLPKNFYCEVPSPATNIRASITPLISSVRIFRQALGVFDFMASCCSSRWSYRRNEARNVKRSGKLLNRITAFQLGNKRTENFSIFSHKSLPTEHRCISMTKGSYNRSPKEEQDFMASQKIGSNHSSFTFPVKSSGWTTCDLYLRYWLRCIVNLWWQRNSRMLIKSLKDV